jgi:rubrerythrin
MNNEEQLSVTAKVMRCKNCNYRVIQSEVEKNEGNCPNCNEKFHPLDESSYKNYCGKEP